MLNLIKRNERKTLTHRESKKFRRRQRKEQRRINRNNKGLIKRVGASLTVTFAKHILQNIESAMTSSSLLSSASSASLLSSSPADVLPPCTNSKSSDNSYSNNNNDDSNNNNAYLPFSASSSQHNAFNNNNNDGGGAFPCSNNDNANIILSTALNSPALPSADLWDINETYATNLAPAMAFIALLMIIGIFGNILVVYVYGFRFKTGTQHFLIVCLACFDLIMCTVAMPTEMADMRFHHTFTSVFACKLLRFVTMFASISSSFTLVMVAYDRHKRITNPLSIQTNLKIAKLWTLLSMLAALFFSWPTLVLTGLRPSDTGIPGLHGTDCSYSERFQNTEYPLAFNTILGIGFLTIITVLIIFYFRIWKTARARKFHVAKRYTVGSLSARSISGIEDNYFKNEISSGDYGHDDNIDRKNNGEIVRKNDMISSGRRESFTCEAADKVNYFYVDFRKRKNVRGIDFENDNGLLPNVCKNCNGILVPLNWEKLPEKSFSCKENSSEYHGIECDFYNSERQGSLNENEQDLESRTVDVNIHKENKLEKQRDSENYCFESVGYNSERKGSLNENEPEPELGITDVSKNISIDLPLNIPGCLSDGVENKLENNISPDQEMGKSDSLKNVKIYSNPSVMKNIEINTENKSTARHYYYCQCNIMSEKGDNKLVVGDDDVLKSNQGLDNYIQSENDGNFIKDFNDAEDGGDIRTLNLRSFSHLIQPVRSKPMDIPTCYLNDDNEDAGDSSLYQDIHNHSDIKNNLSSSSSLDQNNCGVSYENESFDGVESSENNGIEINSNKEVKETERNRQFQSDETLTLNNGDIILDKDDCENYDKQNIQNNNNNDIIINPASDFDIPESLNKTHLEKEGTFNISQREINSNSTSEEETSPQNLDQFQESNSKTKIKQCRSNCYRFDKNNKALSAKISLNNIDNKNFKSFLQNKRMSSGSSRNSIDKSEIQKDASSLQSASTFTNDNQKPTRSLSLPSLSHLSTSTTTAQSLYSSTAAFPRKHQQRPKSRCGCLSKNLDKTTIVAFAVSSVFILSFLPFLVLMFMRGINKDFDYHLHGASLCIYHIFLRFYFLNSAINPILYGVLNANFRFECLRMWRRLVESMGEIRNKLLCCGICPRFESSQS